VSVSRTDRQTSCHGIVCAMHTRRVVKTGMKPNRNKICIPHIPIIYWFTLPSSRLWSKLPTWQKWSKIFLSPLGVAHAPFACQHWGLPHRLAQGTTSGKGICSVARHHQANTTMCIMCSCCATSPDREVCRCRTIGEIRSGKTLCHDVYLTTASLAANTYCMMDGHTAIAHALCTPRTVGPRVQFSGVCSQSH